MSEELIVREEAQGVASVQAQPADLLAVVARAASDPSVDVDKMKALLDMQERLMRTRAEVEFRAALARIQPRMPRVTKRGQGHGTIRYAKYEDLDAAIRPLLAEEGFSIDFNTDQTGDRSLKVILCVSHRDGHSEIRQVTLPVDSSGSKNTTQGVGSTFTYGKRYLVQNFFNIITTDDPEDDDGNGGYLTKDQAMNIEALLSETGANLAGFLKFAGAEYVGCIAARDYDKCVRALESKRK